MQPNRHSGNGKRNNKATVETTYRIAHAASWDAANRQMRKAGRTTWNVADCNLACSEFERIYGGAK
jgi:hypothetical protein